MITYNYQDIVSRSIRHFIQVNHHELSVSSGITVLPSMAELVLDAKGNVVLKCWVRSKDGTEFRKIVAIAEE